MVASWEEKSAATRLSASARGSIREESGGAERRKEGGVAPREKEPWRGRGEEGAAGGGAAAGARSGGEGGAHDLRGAPALVSSPTAFDLREASEWQAASVAILASVVMVSVLFRACADSSALSSREEVGVEAVAAKKIELGAPSSRWRAP